MVRTDEQAIVSLRLQVLVQRPDDMPVDFFQGLHFGSSVPFMGRFVGCFDMNDDEVGLSLLEHFDGSTALRFVIGVEIPCGTFDLDNIPAEKASHSPQQVDGRDDRSSFAKSFLK